MSTAIVTGAAGFTGSNLCRHLCQKGYQVKAMIRPGASPKTLEGLDVEILHGDLSVDDGLNQNDFNHVDIVFHIAALFRQEGATRDVFRNVNVAGTRRVLECAQKAGVKRFIHCSTAGVHGEIDPNKPANEDAPLRPGDWYQETKLEGEELARKFGLDHSFPVTIIRPSAICGPGDMRFLKLFRAIQRKTFVMIGSGRHHYHFVYIDDLANGFIKAAETPQAAGETFIIAGPEAVSLKQLIEYVCNTLNTPAPRLRVPVPPVMLAAKTCALICRPLGINPPLYPRRLDFFTKNRSFDASKARNLLGYEPQISPAEAIKKMADWYKQENLL